MNATRLLGILLIGTVTGCAGGWHGGAPPAAWSGGETGAIAAGGAPASAGGKAAAAPATGTHATASGAVFVWKGEGGSVAVAGEFNAWNTTADPLKKQTDGSWTLEKKLEPGRYTYKFVLDGSVWKEDPAATEGVDDGFGGKNSVIVVGAGGAAASAASPAKPAAPAATAAGAGPAVGAGGVTFSFAGNATSVNLAGEFNSWNTSSDPLSKRADGTWTITKKLAPGRYMYKFVINGGTWQEDPNAKESADDGYGGKNSVVVVGAGAVPGGAAPAASTAGGAMTAPPSGAAPAAKGKPPIAGADGVTFTFAGVANTVNLAGDFNAWAISADPLTKQSDGTWTVTKKLAPGSYGYKFVVNGTTWKQDDANPESKDDGFGGKNSLITVK